MHCGLRAARRGPRDQTIAVKQTDLLAGGHGGIAHEQVRTRKGPRAAHATRAQRKRRRGIAPVDRDRLRHGAAPGRAGAQRPRSAGRGATGHRTFLLSGALARRIGAKQQNLSAIALDGDLRAGAMRRPPGRGRQMAMRATKATTARSGMRCGDPWPETRKRCRARERIQHGAHRTIKQALQLATNVTPKRTQLPRFLAPTGRRCCIRSHQPPRPSWPTACAIGQ